MDPATWLSIGTFFLSAPYSRLFDEGLKKLVQMDNSDPHLKALVQKDFNAGKAFLESANRLTSPTEKRKEVEKARDRFVDALGVYSGLVDTNQKYSFDLAHAEYFVAACWYLLGNKDMAIRYWNDSYVSAMWYLSYLQNSIFQTSTLEIPSNLTVESGAAGAVLIGSLLAVGFFPVTAIAAIIGSVGVAVTANELKEKANRDKAARFQKETTPLLEFAKPLRQLLIKKGSKLSYLTDTNHALCVILSRDEN